MAHREKHRAAAQVKRAGQGRTIATDLGADGKPTPAYKAAKKTAAAAKRKAKT